MADETSLRDELEQAFDDDAKVTDKTTDKPDTDALAPALAGAAASSEKTGQGDAASGTDGKPEKSDKPDATAEPKFSYREPPARWTKEAKEQWAKVFGELDPNNPTHKQIGTLRDMMFARHEEAEKTLQERETSLQSQLDEVKGLVTVISPYAQGIRQSGQSVEAVVGDLLKLNAWATSRPDEFLHWFVKERRLDVGKLFGLQQTQNPAGKDDVDADDPLGIIPQRYKDALSLVPQLQQQLQQATAQMQQFGQQWGAFQQNSQRQQAEQAGAHIASWANEKDEAGNLRHPHYSNDSVRAEMIRLMDAGQASTLDEAYDRAIWGLPAVRQHVLESQAARDIAQREARARQDAAKKRSAAVSVGGRSGSIAPSGASQPAGDDIRSILSAEWESMSQV